MAKHATDVLNAYINHIKEKHHDTVDLVVVYGSYARQTMHEASDVDLFIVPKEGKTQTVSVQFILDGIGYDFWPIPWETLQKIATHEVSLQSLLEDAQIVYSSGKEAVSRFEALKEQMQAFDDFASRIPSRLEAAKRLMFDYPKSTADVLYQLSQALCYKNNTYLKKGMFDFESELSGLSNLPDGLLSTMRAYIIRPTKPALEQLITLVESFLSEKQVYVPDASSLVGYYEEIKSLYNKAYGLSDPYKRFFILNAIQKETESFFQNDARLFPDLLPSASDTVLRQHENVLCDYLLAKGIDVLTFETVQDFEAYLKLK